jgi:hypothetical protein
MVAHATNPSYLEGSDQGGSRFEASPRNIVPEISTPKKKKKKKKKNQSKMDWRCGSSSTAPTFQV